MPTGVAGYPQGGWRDARDPMETRKGTSPAELAPERAAAGTVAVQGPRWQVHLRTNVAATLMACRLSCSFHDDDPISITSLVAGLQSRQSRLLLTPPAGAATAAAGSGWCVVTHHGWDRRVRHEASFSRHPVTSNRCCTLHELLRWGLRMWRHADWCLVGRESEESTQLRQFNSSGFRH